MIKSTPKYKYKCIGGPFSGQTLWLTPEGTTLVFQLNGWKGRYTKVGTTEVAWENAK